VLDLGLLFVHVDDLTEVTEVADDGTDELGTCDPHDEEKKGKWF
jgi:hypothetical protein